MFVVVISLLLGGVLGLLIGWMFGTNHVHLFRRFNVSSEKGEQPHYFYGHTSYRRRTGSHTHTRRQAPTPSSTRLDEAYAVLGVRASDSPSQIKKIYRQLMNRYHPDKWMAQPLSREQLKRAEEKAQQITAAYEVIRTARGFR